MTKFQHCVKQREHYVWEVVCEDLLLKRKAAVIHVVDTELVQYFST